MRRLLITGSRKFTDRDTIHRELAARFAPDIVLVSGHAYGADAFCEEVWAELGGRVELYPADWRKHGRRAGLIRNERMAELPGIRECVAFTIDNSSGTAHMITTARNHGIEVSEYTHTAEHDDYQAGLMWKAGQLVEARNYLQRCRIRHPGKAELWNQRDRQILDEIDRRQAQQSLFNLEAS